MRTAAILLCTVMLTSLALSQISLDPSAGQSLFAPGSSWKYLQNSNLNMTVNVGAASSSAQSWTLPTITFTDTVKMDNLLPSATPYASNFGYATHAQRMIQKSGGTTTTMYQYYRVKPDSAFILGNAVRMQGAGKDTTQFTWHRRLVMVFPFTYGTTFTFRDSLPMAPGTHMIQLSTDVCDAFGSLTLLGGTYQAIRKKQTIISQTFFGTFRIAADTFVQYSFMTNGGYNADVTPKDKYPIGSTIAVTGLSYYSIITTPSTSAGRGQTLPNESILAQNYPNPFNPSTTIDYQLSSGCHVSLKIYDVLGEEVAVLVDGLQSAGTHTARFDGSLLRSGVYFYRLQTGTLSETKKLVLIR
jgi:hypothetical protein